MARVVAVLAFFLAVATPAAAGTGNPRPFLTGTEQVPLASDGGRYLAYQVEEAGIRLYDPVAGTTRSVGVGDSCRLIGMAAGKALVACGTRGVLVDASSGATRDLPVPSDWGGMGRRWATGNVPDAQHPPETQLVNWRTGEERFVNEYGPFDLDAEDPVALPARTLYRKRHGRLLFTQTVTSFEPGFQSILALHRRGGERTVVSRANGTIASVSFSAGLASWSTLGVASAYDIARHRRLRWSFKRRTIDFVTVAHTKRHVFFEVHTPEGYELFVVRWRH